MHQTEVSPRASASSRTSSSRTSSNRSRREHDILIVVDAYDCLQLRPDAFDFTLNKVLERTTRKVVVISCLAHVFMSRLDISKASQNVRDKETRKQRLSLDHSLRQFRSLLRDRGVELDVRILAGPKESTVIQVAKALSPNWTIVDSSFSAHRPTLEQELVNSCSLVFIGTDGPKSHKILINDIFISPEDPEAVEPAVHILPQEISEQERSRVPSSGRPTRVESRHSSHTRTQAGTSQTSAVNCCNGWFRFCHGSTSTSSRTVIEAKRTTRMETLPQDGASHG